MTSPCAKTRAFVYAHSGKTDLAAAEMGVDQRVAGSRTRPAPRTPLCYNQAMWNLSLDKALADCDTAVALSPRSAAILDSRALVLLRLGRLDEALA